MACDCRPEPAKEACGGSLKLSRGPASVEKSFTSPRTRRACTAAHVPRVWRRLRAGGHHRDADGARGAADLGRGEVRGLITDPHAEERRDSDASRSMAAGAERAAILRDAPLRSLT